MTIGQRIKQARLEIKMKQIELAKKSGIAQGTLSELENGDSASSAYLPSLAAVLGVNALWLQKAKGPKYPISTISPNELMIIAAYRSATTEGKTFIEMACGSAPKTPPGPA